jgi:16S rRNA (guanine527-N7)-methyltransferase
VTVPDLPTEVEPVLAVLERSHQVGFLGPGGVREQLDHAIAMAACVTEPPTSVLDLGSGGGVPGLVLALLWPGSEIVLLDAMHKRCRFLDEAVHELNVGARVRVVCERAETAARSPSARGAFSLVTARSFGPPAVAAECATAFLGVGGRVLVSEPPEPNPDRWPPGPLAQLGLAPVAFRASFGYAFAVLERVGADDGRWPRRVGIPNKRPLW